MISLTRYFTTISLLLACLGSLAQADTTDPVRDLNPPKNRELFHDYVDKQQKDILRSDGRVDNQFSPTNDDEVNFILTKVVGDRGKVDWIQYHIEKDSLQNDQVKKKYLKGLENVLKYYNTNWKHGGVNITELPAIVNAYERCMTSDLAGQPIDDIINRLPYDAGMNILIGAQSTFEKNPGYKAGQQILVKKYCALYPDKALLKLRDNTDVPFLDSLIKLAAYRSPGQLYDFAAAGNKLGYAIRRVDDSLVSAVAKMATSNSGRWYFPFLDNIMKGNMSLSEIDAIKDDSIKYYQLLVKTHLDYVRRVMNRDMPYGYKELEQRLTTKATDIFVNTINGLHEIDNPAIRFKIIQPLSAEELYYLAVTTDGIIYTSSFVKGVYPLMMAKSGQRGDSVLKSVMFDKYRKFIKMCAGYNTLNDFLNSFPKSTVSGQEDDAKVLMKAFVNGLEKAERLEDGVDVADSYASIMEMNKPVSDEMLRNVKRNYDLNLQRNNKKGIVTYNLLYKLFLSADSSRHIDLSKEFGIPPVYTVPYRALANDSGRVVMQVFFYGDKDGQVIFPGFKKIFSDPKLWKITTTKYWVKINSVKGKPVSIYANLPLPEETGEDEKAQDALDSFLLKNNLYPTVVIHRGHSYWAPYTIDQIMPSARIVFMGSCGGYHLIHDILKHSADAHIIASKQIGKTAVNQPFFKILTDKLRNGQDIEWIPFWEELEKTLDKQKKSEGFEDYIPPYKNLGAIFIKAYKMQMGDTEE
jgi:hypothetical protein